LKLNILRGRLIQAEVLLNIGNEVKPRSLTSEASDSQQDNFCNLEDEFAIQNDIECEKMDCQYTIYYLTVYCGLVAGISMVLSPSIPVLIPCS